MNELILGPDLVVTKRHLVGELLSMAVSFGPLHEDLLPVEYRVGNEDLILMPLKVTFEVDIRLMSPHHLFAIGAMLEKVFENGLFNFCLGFFQKNAALPWKAAVVAFFTKYDIDMTDRDADYIRRYMHLRYNTTVKEQYKREEQRHLELMGAG